MPEEQDVEVVWRAYEAFDSGDRAAFAHFLAPDVEWHSVAAPLVGVGTIRGREAMLKFAFEDMPEAIEGFRARPDEITDLGNHRVLVAGVFQGRGRTSGVEVNMRVASVYEIRDGMVASVRDYGSRDEALEAVGLRE
jgi:ketosteroid isomerase-like protein